MDEKRVQKSGDQLAVGDWLAPGELLDGAAEVLYVHAWPASADRSRDADGKHVRLVVREQGSTPDYSDVVSGASLFELATKADLAALREQADRAKLIADARAMLDWLEDNPQIPDPYSFHEQSYGLDGAEGVATVRALAEDFGQKVRELDDRTEFKMTFGRATYAVIAWHHDGHPSEPKPEPEESFRGIDGHVEAGGWKGEGPGTCGVECSCGTTYDGFDSLAEASAALARHIADPTGLAASRADDEPDDPTPVTGARVEPHVGAVTDEGLVDETPRVVHMTYADGDTVCKAKGAQSFLWADVTCPDCVKAAL